MWVYKIQNDINDKVYVGQTIRPVQQRFHRHVADAMSGRLDTHFARAIRKYGPQHFTCSIIDVAVNQEQLNQKERYWIQYYDSVANGYNETDAISKCGGNTYKSKSSEEIALIADKIRASKCGGNNPNARRIKMTNLETSDYEIFDSIIGCARRLGINGGKTSITCRLNGTVTKPYKNIYIFEYCET